MKLRKVLTVKEQARTHAALEMAEAQQQVAVIDEQIEQISALSKEYAAEIAAASSAYQLKQRILFLRQLMQARQEQEVHAENLRAHLERCQVHYRKCRAEQKLLENLITKRELDHVSQATKKARRAQIFRPQAKL